MFGEHIMINIKNLSFRYPLSHQWALKDIELHIEPESFVLLTGSSGCGKTTLLRHMKKELIPFGEKKGALYYKDQLIENVDALSSVSQIGFLMQDPSSQIVMDTVWHEIAFGLENIGTPLRQMKRTVAEVVNYFNLHDIYEKNPQELSGGQQQIVNLASIMALKPEILLLDEPTAMLDPVAKRNFLSLLIRIKEEFHMTIVMATHDLDDVLEICDSCIFMEEGQIIFQGNPDQYLSFIQRDKNSFKNMLPEKARLMDVLAYPLTLNRSKIRDALRTAKHQSKVQKFNGGEVVLSANHIYCSYSDKSVLKNLKLDVKSEEILTICGSNGSGKSTLLKCLVNELPYSGSIKTKKKLIYLPQDPTLLFVKDTLQEDLLETGKSNPEYMKKLIAAYGLKSSLVKHPYDLSGGQKQIAALIKVLLCDPDILLLDEPTKGMDRIQMRRFCNTLKELTNKGISIINVTHDLEYAALVSDRIGLMFDGKIEALDHPDEFLINNYFYTTDCAKLTRDTNCPCILPERMEVIHES